MGLKFVKENQLKLFGVFLDVWPDLTWFCIDVASDVIKKRLEIKETKEGVKVQDCQIRVCNTVQELIKALAEGNKAKATGETLMNRDSSRSHCIFTIFVETAVKAAVSIDFLKYFLHGELALT